MRVFAIWVATNPPITRDSPGYLPISCLNAIQEKIWLPLADDAHSGDQALAGRPPPGRVANHPTAAPPPTILTTTFYPTALVCQGSFFEPQHRELDHHMQSCMRMHTHPMGSTAVQRR